MAVVLHRSTPQEITQLRGSDVQRIDGILTLNLTPDAGTIKGGRARLVPIHDHLIDQGFLEFVKSRGDGPLFYRPRRADNPTAAEPMQQRKSPAAQARQRLATWVREIGVTDKAIRPNHAWRHTFKRRAARAKIEQGIRDAICGHSPRTVADIYETPTLDDMAEALKRFPRYELD